MEPMTLGSPNASPCVEQFLPSFLLGENSSNTPKRNKLSPEQDRRLPFGNVKSPTPLSSTMSSETDLMTKPMPNSIKFGPPIIDLYDDMPSTYRNETDAFTSQSLLKKDSAPTQLDSNSDVYNNSDFRSPVNGSYHFNSDASNNVSNMAYKSPYTSPSFTNDMYRSPPMLSHGYKRPYSFTNDNSMFHTPESSMMCNNHYGNIVQQGLWITVFGFPSELSKEVVDFFKNIGKCTDVHLKPNSNFVSLRYSTRYEVQQAISFSGAMFKPGILIGVIHCDDPDYVGKDIITNMPNDRIDYKAKLERLNALSSPSSSNTSLDMSQKSTSGGIVHKALDYLMRW